MKKYVKIYTQHFGYGEQDIILCEVCGKQAVDIHHIKYKSQLGGDNIENLIALCRNCHDQAHSKSIPIYYLQNITKNRNVYNKD